MSYRVDHGKRKAKCRGGRCIKEENQIEKGALRFATLVQIQENQSWTYRHWGCVTDKVIANIRKKLWEDEGKAEEDWDINDLDGWDELTDPDEQETVRKAVIDDGKVATEDLTWPDEADMATPAKVKKGGKRKKAADSDGEDDAPKTKKKAKAAKKDADDGDGDTEKKPKRAKKAKALDEDAGEETPETKPKRAPKAKAKDEDNDASSAPKKGRGRPKKENKPATTEVEKDVTPEVEDADSKERISGNQANTPKKRAHGRGPRKEADGAKDTSAALKNSRRGRPAKKAAPVEDKSEEDGEAEAEVEAAPKPAATEGKRGRGRPKKVQS